MLFDLRSGGPKLQGTQAYPRAFCDRIASYHKKFCLEFWLRTYLQLIHIFNSLSQFAHQSKDTGASPSLPDNHQQCMGPHGHVFGLQSKYGLRFETVHDVFFSIGVQKKTSRHLRLTAICGLTLTWILSLFVSSQVHVAHPAHFATQKCSTNTHTHTRTYSCPGNLCHLPKA